MTTQEVTIYELKMEVEKWEHRFYYVLVVSVMVFLWTWH